MEGALQEGEGVGGDPDGLLRGEMTKNPNLCWEIGWFCISEIARIAGSGSGGGGGGGEGDPLDA